MVISGLSAAPANPAAADIARPAPRHNSRRIIRMLFSPRFDEHRCASADADGGLGRPYIIVFESLRTAPRATRSEAIRDSTDPLTTCVAD
ncbi:hypothetical protein D3C78_1435000 [compost metagenome]